MPKLPDLPDPISITALKNLAPGLRINERFRIERRLSVGAQGVVYRVIDGQSRTARALKFSFASDDDSLARFKREAELGHRLDHHGLMRVHHPRMLSWEGRFFFVMDLFDHASTLDVRYASLEWPALLTIFDQIAMALDYLASKELVHRDLSPRNILVDRDLRVKVIDLGCIRQPYSEMTERSQVMGSAGYKSPEQIARADLAIPKSDQWALGAIVYEVLTGLPPHYHAAMEATDADAQAAVLLSTRAKIPPPSRFNETVTKRLDKIVLRALAHNADDRFPNSAAFVAALENVPILLRRSII